MSSAIAEHADGLPKPQRRWAVLTIALGLVMAGTLIVMLPPLVVVIAMQRWFVRGLVATEK